MLTQGKFIAFLKLYVLGVEGSFPYMGSKLL